MFKVQKKKKSEENNLVLGKHKSIDISCFTNESIYFSKVNTRSLVI
jgi:hypothetical protein